VHKALLPLIRKNRKKFFEDILKNTPINEMNELSNSIKRKQQNLGKIILDPINPDLNGTKNKFFNNNKKMEVSFKATFKISNENGYGNKIEISPQINLHNPKILNVNVNKKLAKLERIPEIKDNRDY